MSKDEPIDGPTEEYRKETVKKLEEKRKLKLLIGIQAMNLWRD
jgi:hypothetical protein